MVQDQVLSNTIWVDADACPKAVKQVLFKAAQRINCKLVLVANHWMQVPSHKNIQLRLVEQGFDKADNLIAENIQAQDLLISADIPLAAEAVAKDAMVLTPRGKSLNKNNIAQRLQMRNMMETLRNAGQLEGGGPPAFSQTDLRSFSNALDKILNKSFR